jgi:hypothetical protein
MRCNVFFVDCPLKFTHAPLKSTCLNVSTTPITAMGCWQCLPLSVVQLKGKHCRKPHCRNGVVDTFRHDHQNLEMSEIFKLNLIIFKQEGLLSWRNLLELQ